MWTFKGESGNIEKIAFASDVIILAVFLWDQIRYGLNMLYLMIPVACIGFYLFFFCMIPEEYRFTADSLRICHKFRRAVVIPYESVFNYEATARDGFINIGQSNRVKLYYMQKNRKTAVICRPKDVESFIEAVKTECPEFHEASDKKSRLEVFFDQK